MLLFGSIIRGKNVAVVVSRRIAKRLGEAREREREMKGSGATNFKINSKGQLRHFNCTIPGRIENVEQRRGGKARSKKEKRGDREEAGRQAGR